MNQFAGPKTNISPAYNGFAVTPSDTVDFTNEARAFIIGGGDGTLVCETVGGDTLTFAGLITGVIYPIALKRVNSTGTGATTIVGLY